MNIILIGGGQGALTLLNYFSKFQDITIVCIVDINENAAAIVKAKEMDIPTSDDLSSTLSNLDADLVIEITGSPKVRNIVFDLLKDDQDIMSSQAARMMCEILEKQTLNNFKVAESLSKEFKNFNINLQATNNNISSSLKDIQNVIRSFKIVALNAKIEAARAGEAGKAFSVVVDTLQNTANDIASAMKGISNASAESEKLLQDLTATEIKLKSNFS